jgi:hypothetical protein
LGLLYIFLDENAEAFADLLIVVYISYIIPYTAYILQSGKDHPLIILNAFYLIFVILSYVSLNELSEYKSTRATRKMTKIIDLTGYRGGILFHNFLLIFAYLACAMLFFWGLPKNVYFPIFLTIPFSGYHVWKMLKLLEVEGDTFFLKELLFCTYHYVFFALLSGIWLLDEVNKYERIIEIKTTNKALELFLSFFPPPLEQETIATEHALGKSSLSLFFPLTIAKFLNVLL